MEVASLDSMHDSLCQIPSFYDQNLQFLWDQPSTPLLDYLPLDKLLGLNMVAVLDQAAEVGMDSLFTYPSNCNNFPSFSDTSSSSSSCLEFGTPLSSPTSATSAHQYPSIIDRTGFPGAPSMLTFEQGGIGQEHIVVMDEALPQPNVDVHFDHNIARSSSLDAMDCSSGDEPLTWLYSENLVSQNPQGSQGLVGAFNKRTYVLDRCAGDTQYSSKKQCTGLQRGPKNPVASKDPQSIAARNRRERISERLKILQDLIPNGSKVDLVTMLEKAISYVKFLQLQVKVLATDEFWPEHGGKAPEVGQVKETIDALLST